MRAACSGQKLCRRSLTCPWHQGRGWEDDWQPTETRSLADALGPRCPLRTRRSPASELGLQGLREDEGRARVHCGIKGAAHPALVLRGVVPTELKDTRAQSGEGQGLLSSPTPPPSCDCSSAEARRVDTLLHVPGESWPLHPELSAGRADSPCLSMHCPSREQGHPASTRQALPWVTRVARPQLPWERS